MLFNSASFAFFLPVVFLLYWVGSRGKLRAQNFLLLVASWFFYACWDWRFLFLLMFSIFLDYFTGLKMETSKTIGRRKFWFWLSIGANLGFLGFFKYYNFFAESFAEAASGLGMRVDPWILQVVLPVGISFYTFHGLSYVIDIYKGRIQAERNFIDYAVFVSFFPLLVAGPIERATHLLPQIKKARVFNYGNAVDGLRQILWGLFKKVVIADNCAIHVNEIFNNSSEYSGSTLALGAILFSFQIYGDFSGYSDIALGTARLFGIELFRNFNFPYFSRDIAEFWRRWHISLTTWFRDYLYIPLGGSKGGTWMKVRNTFVIFLVSGFWHGANWTFIVWGLLNALFFLPLLLIGRHRNNMLPVASGSFFPSFHDAVSILVTFSLTTIAWVFFRAESLNHALAYLTEMFSSSFFDVPSLPRKQDAVRIGLLICVFVSIEWLGRESKYAIEKIGLKWRRVLRYAYYYAMIAAIFWFSEDEQQFIYFQF